jgi:hypothetical protein
MIYRSSKGSNQSLQPDSIAIVKRNKVAIRSDKIMSNPCADNLHWQLHWPIRLKEEVT